MVPASSALVISSSLEGSLVAPGEGGGPLAAGMDPSGPVGFNVDSVGTLSGDDVDTVAGAFVVVAVGAGVVHAATTAKPQTRPSANLAIAVRRSYTRCKSASVERDARISEPNPQRARVSGLKARAVDRPKAHHP